MVLTSWLFAIELGLAQRGVGGLSVMARISSGSDTELNCSTTIEMSQPAQPGEQKLHISGRGQAEADYDFFSLGARFLEARHWQYDFTTDGFRD